MARLGGRRGVEDVWQGLWAAFVVAVALSALLVSLLPSPCDSELDERGSSMKQLANREIGIRWLGSRKPMATIVVPAYQEVENIEALVVEVFGALERAGLADKVQMVIVDDNSGDGSEELVQRLAKEKGYPVGIITRLTEHGLSSAVLEGFLRGEGEVLLCMDADLQHPAAAVPELIKAIAEPMSTCSFALGTRTVPNGVVDEATGESHSWPLHRRIISAGAALLAWPLASPAVSDPMTGFFAMRKGEFHRIHERGDVNAVGFKVALELLVRGQLPHIAEPDSEFAAEGARERVARDWGGIGEADGGHHCEVPFEFGVRMAGESKLSGKVIVSYVRQLASLYVARFPHGIFWAALVCMASLWAAASVVSLTFVRHRASVAVATLLGLGRRNAAWRSSRGGLAWRASGTEETIL